ncbi:MAG TPA: 3-deoxy-8-phosphooctulonate synthase [Flavobacteriales bacterium]|jgi:2-dehydro-3-deoxyphosphooctonate aldolase (KDO 8-P synthase)|nr:3-deoxy-8-phosphooctulonate synthase [Flavobacteriales bacterium]HHZ95883.1 3-deoxy-8-phosphooctulonate synthase [Flavobacteriales bacterium]HIB76458.1 3-deoxy-8-phosphooctulonate synthase [Flavobacteriales bacterium]HIN42053.1 3-deoxy-8-phosphooctulonate synthase [Flavobacteriales bacterium]HIO15583.1 3-deoxy-8-phosphooctulonate synthase [Flavobacteriales bacterium]
MDSQAFPNRWTQGQKTAFQEVSGGKLLVIAGPCVVEGEKPLFEVAERVIGTCRDLGLPVIFKASYRKANRSRIDSFTGIGDVEALKLLGEVRKRYGVKVVTDIHTAEEAAMASEYVDVLQIPAFLCRQTDLLIAAARTGKTVNIKKGQFLSAESMIHAVQKVRDAGNEDVWVTERGTTFGYEDLVVDMRGIPVMRSFAPTVMDLTHSLQRPNQTSGVTGGTPHFIAPLGRAAVAAGADAVFIETHPRPSEALSDGANMLHLDDLPSLLKSLSAIHESVRL